MRSQGKPDFLDQQGQAFRLALDRLAFVEQLFAAGGKRLPQPLGHLVDVRFLSGEGYEVAVRGHRVLVDQPADAGGADGAPTPTELFVASLATCIAFYAGRYLTRHGFTRDGRGVSVDFDMAEDRPARVTVVRLR